MPPKLAVYGAHPTKPSTSTARTRSRSELLQLQKQPPTQGWTTSSVHPSHSRLDRSGDVAADHLVESDEERYSAAGGHHRYGQYQDVARMVGDYTSNLKEQRDILQSTVDMYQKGSRGGQQSNQSHQRPASGAAGGNTPRGARTVSKLRDATSGAGHYQNTSTGSPNMHSHTARPSSTMSRTSRTPGAGGASAVKKGQTPMVETHNSHLMEHLQKDAHDSWADADAAQREAEQQRQHNEMLRQELHQARQLAAAQRSASAAAQKERDQAFNDTRDLENRLTDAHGNVELLQRRFDFAMEELQSVKQELDIARLSQRQQKPRREDDVDNVEPLRAQIAELSEQLDSRDRRIDELLATNERLVQEQTKLFHTLRHEEQRTAMLAAEKESAKVLLRDTESEVQLLRTENGGLKEEVERLSNRCSDLSARLQGDLETRNIRDSRLQQTVDSNKALQAEVESIMKCYHAEKAVNEDIRAEVDSYKRLTDDLRRQLHNSQARFTELQGTCKDLEETYKRNVSAFEQSVSQWRQAHASQISLETKQFEATLNAVGRMKQEVDSVAAKSTKYQDVPTSDLHQPRPQSSTPTSVGSHTQRPEHQLPSQSSADVLSEAINEALAHRNRQSGSSYASARARSPSPSIGVPAAVIPGSEIPRPQPVSHLESEIATLLQREAADRREAERVMAEAKRAMDTPSPAIATPVGEH